jgi:hypothetical protein
MIYICFRHLAFTVAFVEFRFDRRRTVTKKVAGDEQRCDSRDVTVRFPTRIYVREALDNRCGIVSRLRVLICSAFDMTFVNRDMVFVWCANLSMSMSDRVGMCQRARQNQLQ